MSIHKARERGFAVLVVLWTLALVALLVAHVLANGRTELSIAANRSEAEDVQAIADGAVYQATFRVMPRCRSRIWPAESIRTTSRAR
jgi:general secretion pathway protein K